MTPRASHTSIPSAVPSPHLGLVPPSRYPSVSGSPTLSTASSSPSSPTSGGSTPFRSFRNFLSFGVGGSSKHASSSSVSAIPKSHFSTLGPIRRSVNVERRTSSPQLTSRRSEDDYVLSIDLPRPGGEKTKASSSRQPKSSDPSHTTKSSTAQSSRSHSPVTDSAASSSDTPALAATELSTILESETSGISKHLPSLDTSQAESEQESLQDISPQAFQPQALHPPPRNTRHGSSSPSNDTSALDLSTSKLTSEVLAALSETGDKQDWLQGVVVDDVPSDSAISRERTPESPDTSFNMDSLDPELAALLSPNRVQHSAEPALLIAINAIPSPTSSPPPPPPPKNPSFSSASPSLSTEMLPSTSMRRITTSSLSAAPRLPSSTSLPRITRSVSDRPMFGTATSGLPSPTSRTPSGRAMSSSPERPTSVGSASAVSRLTRGSSFEASASSSFRRPGSGGNADARRTPASRLMTPSRPSSSSGSRPPLSRFNSSQTNGWEADSASPSSRPSSSIGTAPSRLQDHRPSMEMERPRLTGSIRTRKRSTSVIENRVTPKSPMHPPSVPAPRSMTDWLGPRTAKAFAAAGLLDFEKESSVSASRPPSRFGTTRSSIDRDSRSRYTPSRMAFSEAGSSSSWGARSASRAAAYADGDATSTPRTVFSSASTAATSVSASSMQSEIQLLQDKHALETSALLGALADSQRTTKMLRDENGELRDRIQMLEDKLADAQERIQQILYSQGPALPPNAMYPKRYGSPASSGHRSLTHSRNNSLLRARGHPSAYSSPEPPFTSPETPMDNADGFVPPNRKRMSGTSSVFATLPSNMSMIMQEEGVSPESFGAMSMNSSSPPGSPTMVYARLNGASPSSIPKAPSSRAYSHRANRSVSSAGNISPTTASFSIMTGSPGSLNLRPEHEQHLGDMTPLDLDADGFEFDGSSLR
ncbi:hypothetical protein L226DRAFT_572840 [Lentinus tigrinus ALCF2SS1-7]|uniref:Uncharacterized protein n=1 Tax=Lentinus tigrinus ALCF2SS1-6 TaxID=1328759 RepID=A0A5C2S6H6_9APHY|nr:hypothetical protein L227DRAFT_612742 [Lentinus tigrinus ALCF2SS1-6]RPD72719.1 hypothetical protein L226DRAFT_572840 [Lentinus tigrinus ALCF2SS1-7]